MSLQDLEEKISSLKNKVEGDFVDLASHLEAALQHLHISHVEEVIKDAIINSLYGVAVKADNIANNWVLPTTQEVEAAVTAVKAARKATSTKPATI